MEDIQFRKQLLRKTIVDIRKSYQQNELKEMSEMVLCNLEQMELFKKARTVFAYHSLPKEVSTIEFLRKWKDKKDIYLPVVQGNDISFRKYISEDKLIKSNYGIYEPEGKNIEIERLTADLIIIPGVAFDFKKNRMGYGKGFYDRFLKKIKTIKIGVCFNFQIINDIPVNMEDVNMDYIVTDEGIIV